MQERSNKPSWESKWNGHQWSEHRIAESGHSSLDLEDIQEQVHHHFEIYKNSILFVLYTSFSFLPDTGISSAISLAQIQKGLA